MELLIHAVNKINPDDVFKDVKLLKRGDVIDACPDGWNWSKNEINHPDWIIMKFPDVPVEEATLLLSPEIATDHPIIGENMMLQARGFYIDLDMEQTDVHTMTKRRPPRANPHIIG